MLENFAILHQSGECLFLKNYKGQPLDVDMVTGFTSYTALLSTATNAHRPTPDHDAGYAPCVVCMSGRQFVSLRAGPFVLLSQGPEWESRESLVQSTRSVLDIIQAYLGEFTKMAVDDLDLINGILDIIDSHLQSLVTELSTVVGGCQWMLSVEERREHLDRIMARLERHDFVLGSSLTLGSSVLHARLPPQEVGLILQHIRSRPLHKTRSKIRLLPLFTGGRWKYITLVRIRGMVLAVVASINAGAAFKELISSIQDFESELSECSNSLKLPVEEPPVLLRYFTGQDTLAFVYLDRKSGAVVAPLPRPGPASEPAKFASAFSWFTSQVADALSNLNKPTTNPLTNTASDSMDEAPNDGENQGPSSADAASQRSQARRKWHEGPTSEVALQGNGFRFHCLQSDSYVFYALYSSNISSTAMDSASRDILSNVQRRLPSTVGTR